jgi:hypothetical protein
MDGGDFGFGLVWSLYVAYYVICLYVVPCFLCFYVVVHMYSSNYICIVTTDSGLYVFKLFFAIGDYAIEKLCNSLLTCSFWFSLWHFCKLG